MKKFIILLLAISLSIFVTACGSEDYAGDTNSDTQSNEEENNNEDSNDTKEEPKVEQEPKLEIAKNTGGAWKDSIDTVWVHSSAIFENTGDAPIEIGETQMNFKGTDGSILGTTSMVYSVPSVVLPGETAFITESTVLDGVTDASTYEETTYNFSFDKTDKDPNLLEVSGVKGTVGDEFSNPYKVTGIVKNTTEEKQDDIRIAAGLFDEDEKLLGVLKGSVDVGVNPGSESGFELNYPEIPEDVASDIKNVEVKAYGWDW